MTTITNTSPAGAAAARRGWFRKVFTLGITFLAFAFLWKVLRDVGLAELGSRLMSADPILVGLAAALSVLRFLMLALRWEILVRREAPVGLRQIAPVLMAGNFVGLVTPVVRVAGPILRAFYLSRETGRPRARFYGTIVADQASNFTIYALATAIGGALVTLPGSFQISVLGGAAMLGALTGGLSVGWWMLRDVHDGAPSRVGRTLTRLLGTRAEAGLGHRLIRWWEDLSHALSRAVIGTGAWWPSLALSAAIFAAVVAAQMLVFQAIGTRVGSMEVVFAVAGAGFLQVIAAAPGGPGVTEASLLAVFLALGVDRESAAAGALLARLVNYAVLIPWGGLAFFRLQRRYGIPRQPAGQAAV